MEVYFPSSVDKLHWQVDKFTANYSYQSREKANYSY